MAASPEAEEELLSLLSEPMEFMPYTDTLDPSADSRAAAVGATGAHRGVLSVRRGQQDGGKGPLLRLQSPVRMHSASFTSIGHLLSSGHQPCIASQKRRAGRMPADSCCVISRVYS